MAEAVSWQIKQRGLDLKPSMELLSHAPSPLVRSNLAFPLQRTLLITAHCTF
jgi:hypothetical protein